jgi:hypothetical protein
MRDYLLRSMPPGQRGRAIADYDTADTHRELLRDVLWLPDGLAPEVMSEILAALRTARQEGREERSAELIPHLDEARDHLRDIVRDEAVDAIRQWGTGWTEPDHTREPAQYYIVLERSDDPNHILYLGIREGRHGDIVRHLRVQVLVEGVPQR